MVVRQLHMLGTLCRICSTGRMLYQYAPVGKLRCSQCTAVCEEKEEWNSGEEGKHTGSTYLDAVMRSVPKYKPYDAGTIREEYYPWNPLFVWEKMGEARGGCDGRC